MTFRFQSDPRGTTVLTCVADTEVIPPYALVEVYNDVVSGGIFSFNVRRYASTGVERQFLFNGPNQVGISSPLDGHNPYTPQWVLYNVEDGTPAYGEVWGPKQGEFHLVRSRTGFFIWGNAGLVESTAGEAEPDRLYKVLATRIPSREIVYEGYLCEDLDFGSFPGAGSTATAMAYDKDGNAFEEFMITNHDETLSLEEGTFIQWRLVNEVWQIEWAACAPTGVCPTLE